MPTAVELREIGRFRTSELAQPLHALVQSNRYRIARDFPQVVGRYVTMPEATRSVTVRKADVARSNGQYNVYVVLADEKVVGLATVVQCTLKRKVPFLGVFTRKVFAVEGPQLAMWLGGNRVPHHRGLLPHLLPLFAAKIRDNASLTGVPWTLVRPDHTHVIDCLEQPGNGFGPFTPWYSPQPWPHVDGVTEPRQLYVSPRNVAGLR